MEVPEPESLKPDELSRYVDSVLRFVPVEVAMRYYSQPLLDDGSSGLQAYSDVLHEKLLPGESLALNDQAYEHPFNACVVRARSLCSLCSLCSLLPALASRPAPPPLSHRFFSSLLSLLSLLLSRLSHRSSRTFLASRSSPTSCCESAARREQRS
jgi:hypothetical protein